MERRKAITLAGAASLTPLAGAAGIAINSGIVGTDSDDNVGNLSPVEAPDTPNAVDTGDAAMGTPRPALLGQPSNGTPLTTSSASGTGFDDDHDDDDHDDDDHEYEGADDDD